MRQVAEHAGVAISSVSRVLNDHPDVSASMRKRVMAAIGTLGYEPDLLARSLRRGSTRTVGFVLRDISNPLFADSAEYSLLLTNSDGNPGLDADHIRLLTRRRVDGLILSLEAENHPPTLAALADAQGALVLLDREVPAIRASSVVANHYLGVRDAVLDLLRAPGSRVAYIGGPDAVRASRERLRAYLDAHEALGRRPDSDLMRYGSYTEDFGREQAAQLLVDHRPTGLLAGGAQISLGVLSAIRGSGRKIGVDIDLVAVDGIPLMRTFEPPISTVDRDAIAFGEAAAQLLIEMLEDDAPPRVVTLPTEYVRRSSVRASIDPTAVDPRRDSV
jgi:LacI family transcriptional regulator